MVTETVGFRLNSHGGRLIGRCSTVGTSRSRDGWRTGSGAATGA